ncbi:hypothetical protein [Phytohabitans rumicis]
MQDVLTQLKATADAGVHTPTWSLRDDELIESLDAVHAITQAVAALQSRLVREIDSRGLAIAQHASSTKAWLREHLRISPHAAKRILELAQASTHAPSWPKRSPTAWSTPSKPRSSPPQYSSFPPTWSAKRKRP